MSQDIQAFLQLHNALAAVALVLEALDAMEMPVEEQQNLLDELKAAIDSGEFFKNARPITEEEYEELVEEGILSALDDDDVGSKPPTIN